jgi:hypothetical protein
MNLFWIFLILFFKGTYSESCFKICFQHCPPEPFPSPQIVSVLMNEKEYSADVYWEKNDKTKCCQVICYI